MRRFEFRLQKALHFVRLRETMKKMELSAHLQRLRFLEKREAALRQSVREILGKLNSHPSPEWYSYQTTKITLDAQEATRLTKLIEEERFAVTEKQRELSRLLQRKKALESLREKRYQEFRTDQNRREARGLDDVYQDLRRWEQGA